MNMDADLWLQEAYGEYGTAMYRYILSLVKDVHAAEDLMQDVFVKAYISVSSGTVLRNEKAWLFRVARNLALDHLRRRGKVIYMEELPESEIPDGSSPENRLSLWELLKIMEGLPDVDQEVLRLRLFGDMSFREIGVLLKRPAGTVRKRYDRALTKIRVRYEGGKI